MKINGAAKEWARGSLPGWLVTGLLAMLAWMAQQHYSLLSSQLKEVGALASGNFTSIAVLKEHETETRKIVDQLIADRQAILTELRAINKR